MQKLLSYIAVGIFLTVSVACTKYTDITPKGRLVLENAEEYYNLVSLPNRAYPTNQFYLLADDMWLKESTILSASKNLTSIHFLFDSSETRLKYVSGFTLYNQAYNYINRWNMVVTLVGDSKGEESVKTLATAEARVLRAFDHFVLVNTFANHYNPATAATDGGICIMDKYDLESVPTKSSVAAVYAFIEKDLEESIPYLQVNPKDIYHPSLAFAWAFKAKVHLFKKEFAKAKEAALKALTYNNSVYDLVEYTRLGGPSKVNVPAGVNPEVLSYMYMTGYTEMNFLNYVITTELKDLFGKNDARYNLFFATSGSYVDAGSNTAFWNVKNTAFFYPTVGMKSPETWLMLAECYAREGSLKEAMDIINMLRNKRITVASEATLAVPGTIKETMNIIINERRKELLFGFNRLWDLRRLNTEPDYAKTVVRKFPVVTTSVPQQTYTLPPNSRLYTLPFAPDVLKLNPGLTINTGEEIPW